MDLETLRKRAGLSQEALARRLELSRATVASWEQGRTEPALSMAVRLAGILGVSLDQLAKSIK